MDVSPSTADFEKMISAAIFRATIDVDHWQADPKAVIEIVLLMKQSPSLASKVVKLLAARIRDRSPATSYLAIKLLSRCMPSEENLRREAAKQILGRVAYLAVPGVGTHPRLQGIAAAAIRRWASDYGSEEPAFAAAATALLRQEAGASSQSGIFRLFLAGRPPPPTPIDCAPEAQRLARMRRVLPEHSLMALVPCSLTQRCDESSAANMTVESDEKLSGSEPPGPTAMPAARTARPPGCRDLACLVPLVLVWTAWALLGWATVSYGCPSRCNDPLRMVRYESLGPRACRLTAVSPLSSMLGERAALVVLRRRCAARPSLGSTLQPSSRVQLAALILPFFHLMRSMTCFHSL